MEKGDCREKMGQSRQAGPDYQPIRPIQMCVSRNDGGWSNQRKKGLRFGNRPGECAVWGDAGAYRDHMMSADEG